MAGRSMRFQRGTVRPCLRCLFARSHRTRFLLFRNCSLQLKEKSTLTPLFFNLLALGVAHWESLVQLDLTFESGK